MLGILEALAADVSLLEARVEEILRRVRRLEGVIKVPCKGKKRKGKK